MQIGWEAGMLGGLKALSLPSLPAFELPCFQASPAFKP